MSQPAAVPIPPDLSARYNRSLEGRRWLAALPGLLAECLEQWDLGVDLPPGDLPWSGHGALVLPVRRTDGTPAALKDRLPARRSAGGTPCT